MATAAQLRGLSNVPKLRLKLRKMEAYVKSGIPAAIEEIARAIESDAKQNVPKDTGDLKQSIEYKLSSDKLAATIGPAAKAAVISKSIRDADMQKQAATKLGATSADRLMQFFKGVWIEFGTKGNPEKGIPEQKANRFMGPAFDQNVGWGARKITKVVNEQLKKVAAL